MGLFPLNVGSGSGITSIALTLPAMFSVAGSPVTPPGGTFAVSLVNQSAGVALMGPATGSPAAPTFRNLVASDIPNLTIGPNLKYTGSTLDTIQGIQTTDTPQFARLGLGVPAGSTTLLTVSANSTVPTPVSPTLLSITGADGASAAMTLDAFGSAGTIRFRASGGTAASPTALLANAVIGQFSARGYGSTAYSTGRASLSFYAAENWSDTAQGTRIGFNTTLSGSTTLAERFSVENDGQVKVTASLSSTSSTTGALVVAGGVGIGGDSNLGGDLNVKGGVTTLDLGSGSLPSTISGGETPLRISVADGDQPTIEALSFGGQGLKLSSIIAGGSRSSPSAVGGGTEFFILSACGYDGTPSVIADAGYYSILADGNWSTSNHGTYHSWFGTKNGTTTVLELMKLDGTGLTLDSALAVSSGGTGVKTITGLIKGNGTSAFSAALAGTDYVAPGAVTTSGLTMATGKLLGRSTASTGAIEEITIGSGLSLSGGTLSASGGGGGTVTSVGLSAPGIFTVSGSPVTTSGSLTFALNNQSANTFFGGPSSGSAAAPTFRALAAADIPDLGATALLSIGLTATPGSATTYLRSDSSQAIDQSIAPTWTSEHTFNRAGIATTVTDGILLTNTTAATSGTTVQYSPALQFHGAAWKSNTVAQSRAFDVRMYAQPINGTGSTSGQFNIELSVNGGAYTNYLSISSGGLTTVFNLTVTGALTVSQVIASSSLQSPVLALSNATSGQNLNVVNSSTIGTAARTLSLYTGDGDVTLNLAAGTTITIDNWFDQSVKTTASPTFAGLTSNGDVAIGTSATGSAVHVLEVGGGASSGGGAYLAFDRNGLPKNYIGASSALHANNTDDMDLVSSGGIGIYPSGNFSLFQSVSNGYNTYVIKNTATDGYDQIAMIANVAGAAKEADIQFAPGTFFRINVGTSDPFRIDINGSQVAQFTTTGLNSCAIGVTTPSTGSFTQVLINASSTVASAKFLSISSDGVYNAIFSGASKAIGLYSSSVGSFIQGVSSDTSTFQPLTIAASVLELWTTQKAMAIDANMNFFFANSTSVPASNPTGGGYFYVQSGALKYRGSSGTVTTLGNA